MNKQLGYIYQNSEGEYFESIEHNGHIVLSNPSYPFHFLFEVLEPLTLIGKVEDFEHLLKKTRKEFIEADTLSLSVDNDGNLKVENK